VPWQSQPLYGQSVIATTWTFAVARMSNHLVAISYRDR